LSQGSVGRASEPDVVGSLQGVSRHYKVRLGGGRTATLRAVDGVDLSFTRGRTLGLVGESGSGKSTIARLMLRLVDATSGRVCLDGEDITHARGHKLRAARTRMQLVFQDPYSSFDPRVSMNDSIAEALRRTSLSRGEVAERCSELLEMVGLTGIHGLRRPGELSGGQLQRAAIGRALAVNPSLIALDEPVSSLDVSTQVLIIDLLARLQNDLGVAMLFISHDLTVVRDISDDIAVMYLGKIVEKGVANTLFNAPSHPYTQALLSAAPRMMSDSKQRSQRLLLEGELPSPLNPPAGCRFHTRCPKAMPRCSEIEPAFEIRDGNHVACHLYTREPVESAPAQPARIGRATARRATWRDAVG